MEILVTIFISAATFAVAHANIRDKKTLLYYIEKKIELTKEKIEILKELYAMDDKMENLLIDTIKGMQSDISKINDRINSIEVRMAKYAGAIGVITGIMAFIAPFVKELVFKS